MIRQSQNPFLEPSPYEADEGHFIGKDPRNIRRADLAALGAPQSPIRAIRAKCLDCSGGVVSEIRKCVLTGCALWPFRMGTNVFHARSREAAPEEIAMD